MNKDLEKAIENIKSVRLADEKEYKENKRIQELSDELIDKFTYAPIWELPWMLEARVKQNCKLD